MEIESAGRYSVAAASPEGSEARLVSELRHHSQDSLAEIFRRHGGAVLGLARRSSGDPAAAEDIAQEVFLALWRDPERFEPSRGSLRSYLLAMTHHRAIDSYRSERSRRGRQDRFYPATDSRSALEDAVVTADEAERVRRSLNRLPSDEREAIDLAYFRHHTYREVAQLLGQPEGTVKSRIRNGLRRLRSAPELVMAFAGPPQGGAALVE